MADKKSIDAAKEEAHTSKKTVTKKVRQEKGIKNKKDDKTGESQVCIHDDRPVEEILADIEDVIKKLSDDEISLEDSIKTYENGMMLMAGVKSRLDKAQRQIIILENKYTKKSDKKDKTVDDDFADSFKNDISDKETEVD